MVSKSELRIHILGRRGEDFKRASHLLPDWLGQYKDDCQTGNLIYKGDYSAVVLNS